MGTVIGLVIIVLIFASCKWDLNKRVDTYPLDKVDTSKMIADRVMNNLSDAQVQRNMVNGKYDKK